MLQPTSRSYLKSQYEDPCNFNARVALHRRFGTAKSDWQSWVFDQITLPAHAHILELGCGLGRLWSQNLHRLPVGWGITLSDLSPGMVEQTRQNLAASRRPFAFVQCDAQTIPFGDSRFDLVIANHMLYHVPDRQKAYAEVRRVLKPAGRLVAAANSRDTMRQIKELESEVGIVGGVQDFLSSADFSLENGETDLAQRFPRITLRRQEEALLVTEAQPLIDYILSVAAKPAVNRGVLDRMRKRIEIEIKAHGAFRIDKISGIFIAEK